MFKETIEKYIPQNEQEVNDKEAMLTFLLRNEDSLERKNKIAHFTNSAIIVNQRKDKVLFVNHLIYKSWGWVGGHNDGNPDFLDVVLREAKEETGLEHVYPLIKEPVALDNIFVPNHIKNGAFVGDHIHMNLAYLLVADENEPLKINVNENSGVAWFPIEEIFNVINEERMVPIYQKMLSALQALI